MNTAVVRASASRWLKCARIFLRNGFFDEPQLNVDGATADDWDSDQSLRDLHRLCDGWLQIEVRGHRIRPGIPCPFSIEYQCSIYSERPQHPAANSAAAGWLHRALPDWMRPDKSDLILLPANFLWRGLPVDVAVAAAPEDQGTRLAEEIQF